MKLSISLPGLWRILFWFCTVFSAVSTSAQGWQLTTLHSFGFPTNSANRPSSGVILASDGKLYGTANQGGAHNGGAIFRLNKDGSGFQIIFDFDPGQYWTGAHNPLAGVLEASDGKLYGTTLGGGDQGGGVIFSLNRDGSGFQVLYEFESSTDGNSDRAYGELIEGRDGLLYGTTRSGGTLGNGTVFRIAKDGSAYEVIHEFDFNSGQGAFPEAPLLLGSDGVMYGATSDHDSDIDPPGAGKIFRINPDGSGYIVIHDFDLKSGDGNYPAFGLTEGRDGALYGTTLNGGAADGGVVFKLRKNGAGYRMLWSLPRGSLPFGPLRESASGLLYGITELGGPRSSGTLFSIDENGNSPRVVDSFGRSARDVFLPVGPLAQGAVGNFYGVGMAGGLGAGGTIFWYTAQSPHQVLHSFNVGGGDGAFADSPLSLGKNGVLYGTTDAGGRIGYGTVYQVNPNGSDYKILVNLSERPAGVTADTTNGDLYLTTLGQPVYVHGVQFRGGRLYRVTQDGKMKLLHGFPIVRSYYSGPSVPLAASDGMLYGIVPGGEKAKSGFIYRIQKNGKGFQILCAFTNYAAFPPMIEGSDGMLYGMQPGYYQTQAAVFKIAKDGTGFATLHTFSGNQYEWNAYSLVEGTDGLIYGTTAEAPAVAFRLNKNGGNFQIIHSFSGGVSALTKGNDGGFYGLDRFGSLFRLDTDLGFTTYGPPIFDESISALTALPDGALCGTSRAGGDLNIGLVFRLTPP